MWGTTINTDSQKNIRSPQRYRKKDSSTISKPECVSVIPPLPERRTTKANLPTLSELPVGRFGLRPDTRTLQLENKKTGKQNNNYSKVIHTLLLRWCPVSQLPGLTIIMVSCFPRSWKTGNHYNSKSRELETGNHYNSK